MSKSKFLTLTLANGSKTIIIHPKHIAFAMSIEDKNDHGEVISFTRIIPNGIVIDDNTNWVDVKETPAEILSKMN